MFKDKFVLTISLATIVILIGVIFYLLRPGQSATQTTQPTSETAMALLALSDDDWVKGNRQAPVTLIEYLDFECEVCKTYEPLVMQLTDEFPTEVAIVSRYFPLTGHKNAYPAALAVEAAGRQGKYWEMRKVLFEDQAKWGGKSLPEPSLFEAYAAQIGLDMDRFKQDVVSQSVRDRVNRDLGAGEKLSVSGTPSFFLAGTKINNPRSLEDFRVLIKAALLNAPMPTQEARGEKVHEHADLKVYLDGQKLDLSVAKYQSTEEKELDPDIHLHDGNGDVVHKHRQGVTLGDLFRSLKIEFSRDCLVLDTGKRYCNTDTKSLKMLVNGQPNDQFDRYVFTDLDKILLSYGPKDETLTSQLDSISDQACLYSEKCPERGKPPTEKCVGGLGDDC